jgi:hypothetical protein
VGDPALLGIGDEVIDKNTDPTTPIWLDVGQSLSQMVDALEVLDDDTFDAQVVTPDLLDELGVMAALDEDPAGSGYPGRGAYRREGTRSRARAATRSRAWWRSENDWPALEEETRPERKTAAPSSTILELYGVEVAVDTYDLTAPIRRHLLDDQVRLGDDLLGAATLRDAPVSAQYVGAIPVEGHAGRR